MSKPTTASLRRLRRNGRYSKMHPRLFWKYGMQSEVGGLMVQTDADWAGCRRARKSTSGGTISRGSHCIKTWSNTQAVIAKSLAESELYGGFVEPVKVLGQGPCVRIWASHWALCSRLTPQLPNGIVDRTGLAKVRHIDVNCLWLQEQCAKKCVPLVKIPGEHNSADLMTKQLIL